LLHRDEHARLLAYSIDLLTTDHPFLQDIPFPTNHHPHRKKRKSSGFSSPTPK